MLRDTFVLQYASTTEEVNDEGDTVNTRKPHLIINKWCYDK